MPHSADKNGGLTRLGPNVERASLQVKFESLIKGCAHTGDIAAAKAVLRAMYESGEPPLLDNYNSIVHACAQASDVVRAQIYLRRMLEIGLTPNTVTYNLVINACAAKGEVAEAEMWLLHMKTRGLQPTEVTYGTICKALARAGSIEHIEEIMAQLEQDGLVLNEYFYASLISACRDCDPPNLARAERVPSEMLAKGVHPKSVRRALDRALGPRRAQQLFAELDLSYRERKSDASKFSSKSSVSSDPPSARTRTTSPLERLPEFAAACAQNGAAWPSGADASAGAPAPRYRAEVVPAGAITGAAWPDWALRAGAAAGTPPPCSGTALMPAGATCGSVMPAGATCGSVMPADATCGAAWPYGASNAVGPTMVCCWVMAQPMLMNSCVMLVPAYGGAQQHGQLSFSA